MPTKKKILGYWQTHYKKLFINREDENVPWEHECFACGNPWDGLHRAHIIPLNKNGTNELSNLHLLCPSCHFESEGLNEYWIWFKYQRENEWHYPMYYLEKKLKKIGICLKKRAEELLLEGPITEQVIQREFQSIINKLRINNV